MSFAPSTHHFVVKVPFTRGMFTRVTVDTWYLRLLHMNCLASINGILTHPSNCQITAVFDMITNVPFSGEFLLLKLGLCCFGKLQDINIVWICSLRYVESMINYYYYADDLIEIKSGTTRGMPLHHP